MAHCSFHADVVVLALQALPLTFSFHLPHSQLDELDVSLDQASASVLLASFSSGGSFGIASDAQSLTFDCHC